MRRALEKRGFLLTDNIGSAHIVIAHSGGHLEINDRTQHEKILLIDPAFPNHTPIPINWLKHVGFEFRTILLSRDWPFFVRKYSIHLWYICLAYNAQSFCGINILRLTYENGTIQMSI